ncbi:fatty acyl-AMP ligase [Nocardia cyriacigeorgica]|uniref:fatty acyl-AMP ligase n=1 Tax=Nocardia cyriacigeorgica TaxID=135487 RepID=UPI000CEA401B|nr:fatty acyl-AMP ligase [Nocardia cyriacigeorgica]MBF6321016.1 fatty acyl-AMP ligase [Nocardia cyriacigeorgica]MBF6495283.1 fatty acyl-AMP ligase [Nocardia cyriacigeorgica]PPJ12426.1 peptide synthetase [Nocardia cyriacigeorgica]
MTAPYDLLHERVGSHARDQPNADAFIVLTYRGTERSATALSYSALHRVALEYARLLLGMSAPGDRVVIMCPHGPAYAVAFLACLNSGRIAVPLFPVARPVDTERAAAIIAHARPTVALTAPGDSRTAATIGDIRAVAIDPLADPPTGARPPHIDPASTAYLQYTSGSTRTPAGVDVTHANLAAALRQLRSALPATTVAPIVSWLPFFHDMGLIFGLSLPLYSGMPAVTMAPEEFAKRPARWLRACSDYRAGATATPNFGLALAVSHTSAQEREGLDLSALRVVLNGAEPIRAPTLTAFTDTYAAHGFRHRAHTPGYGLAEATLPVTIADQDAEPTTQVFDRRALGAGRVVVTGDDRAGTRLVGCGVPVGQRVAIVDPDHGTEVEPGRVGEIWVAGPNVGAGYFDNPAVSAATFDQPLSSTTGGWLRTGDLGFRHEGQLYIAGRRKDLIVVDGRNHYPADIEATAAACAPELRPGRIAAFGHDDGSSEQLVLVAETRTTGVRDTQIHHRIRAAVAAVHGIVPREIVLTACGRLPLTSSGKIRRSACRDRYAAGTL